MATEDFEEEAPKATLIKAYGEFWNPEYVNWSVPKRLLGKADKKSVNIWEQRGVYVLYNDYEPVYVGKAFGECIGSRIRRHRASYRKGARWDSFSWYGLQRFKNDGNPREHRTRANVAMTMLVDTLEAVLIAVTDPHLNARRESLKDAVLVRQSLEDKQLTTDERLENIETILKGLKDKN